MMEISRLSTSHFMKHDNGIGGAATFESANVRSVSETRRSTTDAGSIPNIREKTISTAMRDTAQQIRRDREDTGSERRPSLHTGTVESMSFLMEAEHSRPPPVAK
jgi:hypothetical protein